MRRSSYNLVVSSSFYGCQRYGKWHIKWLSSLKSVFPSKTAILTVVLRNGQFLDKKCPDNRTDGLHMKNYVLIDEVCFDLCICFKFGVHVTTYPDITREKQLLVKG